jgi:hypothetical protein
MSIILKGIDMPNASNDDMIVIIRHDGNAEVWQSGKKETEAQAVQIPEGHGRLVDLDELSRRMYHEAFETDSDLQKWDGGCWIRYKMFENCRDLSITILDGED